MEPSDEFKIVFHGGLASIAEVLELPFLVAVTIDPASKSVILTRSSNDDMPNLAGLAEEIEAAIDKLIAAKFLTGAGEKRTSKINPELIAIGNYFSRKISQDFFVEMLAKLGSEKEPT
jgi:hypothetical protein